MGNAGCARYASVLAIVALIAPMALSKELLNFKPVPDSPNLAEFAWGGGTPPQLLSGPGSLGNADGTLPVANQTAPGLQIDTPFVIPAVAGSVVGASNTTFYDCSLTINGGFVATGAAA